MSVYLAMECHLQFALKNQLVTNYLRVVLLKNAYIPLGLVESLVDWFDSFFSKQSFLSI